MAVFDFYLKLMMTLISMIIRFHVEGSKVIEGLKILSLGDWMIE